MDRPEWTIPVKCSTVRWIDRIVVKLNWILFGICCIISTIYFILLILRIVPINDLILFMLGYFGVLITGGIISILIVHHWKDIINYIPYIKCVED